MAQTYNNAEVRIRYQVNTLQHTMTLGCNLEVGYSIGQIPNFIQADGLTIAADVALLNLITLFLPYYSADSSFQGYEIWDIDQHVTTPTFVYGQTLGLIGSSGTGAKEAWQFTMLYRADTGKVGRIVFLESIDSNYGTQTRPFGTTMEAIADYVEDFGTWIYHSSGGYPLTVYKNSRTTNNALERKRFGVS